MPFTHGKDAYIFKAKTKVVFVNLGKNATQCIAFSVRIFLFENTSLKN
jgi:hypothetical protein